MSPSRKLELYRGSAYSKKHGSRRQRQDATKRFGTFDIETDPFLHDRVPEPFCCAIYTGSNYEEWWGRDCIARMCEWMRENPGSYYAHNGGKFDFHYLLDYADPHTIKILNGRIARMKMGESTLTDSFLLMPFSLDTYQKMDIDYSKFEADTRQGNKREILQYLYTDCVNLYNLLRGFHETVGNHMTIGSAAFAKLKSIGIDPPKCDEAHDDLFREFYFGGRTQAFKMGHHKNVDLQYIDINSAYPWAMLDSHPWGPSYKMRRKEPKRLGPCFVIFTGRSRGALPVRNPDTGRIEYEDVQGEFKCTGWELIAGLETGTLSIQKIKAIFEPCAVQSFGDYVNEVYAMRQEAKRAGDRIRELAFKYLLNSAYGKFATNPRDFKDFQVLAANDRAEGTEWEFQCDLGEQWNLSLWSRPSQQWWSGFYDVATAASITGKVRAYLWQSICQGEPWYCDTDSIIGHGYRFPESDQLGQWASEGNVTEIAIAGRKNYAAKVGKDTWKIASKGSILDAADVIEIATGKIHTYRQEAPTFRVNGGATFTTRRIRRTEL